MKNKKNTMLKGAFTLSVGAFVSKLLGALYRIPLTNIIGGYGLGLYQMVFPIYTLLLDFSGAGIPNALAKIISSKKNDVRENLAYNYLLTSVKVLCVLGVIFSLLMAIFSFPIAKLQGNHNAYYAYITLSPSVFLVCIISCFRGYFQGLMKMTPTAVSQIVEQIVKLIFGLLLSKLFINNLPFAVAGATLAITLSELFALILLYVCYRKHKNKCAQILSYDRTEFKNRVKSILKTAVPITLIGISLPLSHVFDSFIVVNILKKYRNDATALFGLLSGVTCTVINLPVSICYSIATVSIPYISSEKNLEVINKKTLKAILLTIALSLPNVLICFFFPKLIVKILFSGLKEVEKATSIRLIKLASINVFLLSLLQTTNAILIGRNKLYSPVLSMLIGVVIKVILSILLISNSKLNVYGGVIALIACYFVACLINLLMINKKGKQNAHQTNTNRGYSNSQ